MRRRWMSMKNMLSESSEQSSVEEYGLHYEVAYLPEAEAEPQTGGAAGAGEDSDGDGIIDHPPAFKFALQLVFQMLSSVLRHPTRKPSRSTLNPYLTIILTSQTPSYFGDFGVKYPVGGSRFLLYCCA
jgi:hypothetical protein